MKQVQTIKGLIDRDKLEVKDIVTEGENDRSIGTEWYLNGELVRRDAWVVILSGQAVGAAQGEMG